MRTAGMTPAGANLQASWAFTYDGDGVRTRTLISTWVTDHWVPDAEPTRYFFGGAYEIRPDGTVLNYYSFGAKMVAMREGTTVQYFLTDHLGSILAVTDDQGVVQSEQRYMPFGAVRAGFGPVTQTDFGYTAQRNLPEMGLMDYRARFYSPTVMRFVQADTVVPGAGNPQAWNRYSYVLSNPISRTDPSGHACLDFDAEGKEVKVNCRTGSIIDLPAEMRTPLPPRGGDNGDLPQGGQGGNAASKDDSSSSGSGNPSDVPWFLSPNLRIPWSSPRTCVPTFVYRFCYFATTDITVSTGSWLTVTPEGWTYGIPESGSVTGNPFSGTLTIWTPAVVVGNGDRAAFDRVGLDTSWSDTEAVRWQHTVTQVNGQVATNARTDITVGHDPQQHRLVDAAVLVAVPVIVAVPYALAQPGWLRGACVAAGVNC